MGFPCLNLVQGFAKIANRPEGRLTTWALAQGVVALADLVTQIEAQLVE